VEASRSLETPGAGSRWWLPALATYASLGAFFAVSASIQIKRYPVDGPAAISIYACLLFLLALFLGPAFPTSRDWLRERFRGPVGALGCVVLFLLPYAVYAAGTNDFGWAAGGKTLALAALPFVVFAVFPVSDRRELHWQDGLVLLWLALAILTRQIRGLWNVPVNLDFMARLFVVSVGAWSFLIWRGIENSGFEVKFSRRILVHALLNFAAFSVFAIPLGLTLDFIAWNPAWRGFGQFGFDFITLLLFVAIPEELFFRGLLQNLLEGSWHSRLAAQLAASVAFGFTHILHSPFPNWPYVVLASIAGWFYGSAYRDTRSLMASGTTHALVDAVWRTWFERG
jgi:hypothetical protein